MNISFDGLRTNATRSMNRLYDSLKEVIELKDYDEVSIDMKIDLIKKFNEAAQFVDVFNCLYDDENKDDFNEMENLSIDRLDELGEEDV